MLLPVKALIYRRKIKQTTENHNLAEKLNMHILIPIRLSLSFYPRHSYCYSPLRIVPTS